MKIGAEYLGNNKCNFVVWAPEPKKVELKLLGESERIIEMNPDKRDYWNLQLDGVQPDTKYMYILDNDLTRPDPVSHYQPEGVHGPSQIIDHNSFNWDDQSWKGIKKENYIIYEIHVGTFTPEGTFESIISRLDDLLDIGINAIEIMPIAQFPGERNWGYDGVYTYAPQNSYGGVEGLKNLVNQCHNKGIAVILDVVYNHFGPEGNYGSNFGKYLTDKYKSPWGAAVNFDDAYSTEVRNYFLENAIHWFKNYHIDALRLDAIHSIYDMSAKHILEEVAELTEKYSIEQGRKFYLIAESDLNDSKILKSHEMGGYSLDAQWSDDFHHSLRSLITGENYAYYSDFGKIEHFVKALKEGYAYCHEYSSFRKRVHGNSPQDVPADKFVVFSQNHDQIGNRMLGERLSELTSFEANKLFAGALLLSPYIPLIFMGQEYNEDNPFLYFISHTDSDLVESVRKGRKEEFSSFDWNEFPDPQSPETFQKSKLDWYKRANSSYQQMLSLYKTLIKLRKTISALSVLDKNNMSVSVDSEKKVIFLQRWNKIKDSHVYIIYNFSPNDISIFPHDLDEDKKFFRIIDSAETIWGGKGSNLPDNLKSNISLNIKAHSFALYKNDTL